MDNVEHWLAEYIGSGAGTAIDVGANIGNWTAHLAKLYGYIVSIEPDPDAIITRASVCNTISNVLLIDAAASDKPETLTLYKYEKTCHTSLVPNREDCKPYRFKFEVGCVTLDHVYLSFVEQRYLPIQFVKIDVEGAELLVLRGASRLLREQRPRLIVEIHNPENGKECKELLLAAGYNLRKVLQPWRTEASACANHHFWYVAEPAQQSSLN